MGNLKREYLSAPEKNFYMISKAFIKSINGERNLENTITDEIWVEWGRRGMITPSMQKSLKLVKTHLQKFCYEVEENLAKTELDKLNKQLCRFDYRLVDDYTVQKLLRDITNNMKYAVMERQKLAPILEDIAAVRCVGCTCNYEKCDLFKMLDDISVAYVAEEPTCPYACHLANYSDMELNEIEKIKAAVTERKSVARALGRVTEYENSRRDNKCSNDKLKDGSKKSEKNRNNGPCKTRSDSKKNR